MAMICPICSLSKIKWCCLSCTASHLTASNLTASALCADISIKVEQIGGHIHHAKVSVQIPTANREWSELAIDFSRTRNEHLKHAIAHQKSILESRSALLNTLKSSKRPQSLAEVTDAITKIRQKTAIIRAKITMHHRKHIQTLLNIYRPRTVSRKVKSANTVQIEQRIINTSRFSPSTLSALAPSKFHLVNTYMHHVTQLALHMFRVLSIQPPYEMTTTSKTYVGAVLIEFDSCQQQLGATSDFVVGVAKIAFNLVWLGLVQRVTVERTHWTNHISIISQICRGEMTGRLKGVRNDWLEFDDVLDEYVNEIETKPWDLVESQNGNEVDEAGDWQLL